MTEPRDEQEVFTLVDENGNEELYMELMRFQSDETGKWYICLYPAEEENADEVSIQAFAFEQTGDEEDDEIELQPIENDVEWEMVQEVYNTFIDDEGNVNL